MRRSPCPYGSRSGQSSRSEAFSQETSLSARPVAGLTVAAMVSTSSWRQPSAARGSRCIFGEGARLALSRQCAPAIWRASPWALPCSRNLSDFRIGVTADLDVGGARAVCPGQADRGTGFRRFQAGHGLAAREPARPCASRRRVDLGGAGVEHQAAAFAASNMSSADMRPAPAQCVSDNRLNAEHRRPQALGDRNRALIAAIHRSRPSSRIVQTSSPTES
jgi:hypothetical protein